MKRKHNLILANRWIKMNLGELLKEADRHFPKKSSGTYNYTLGKFPQGWKFSVVSNWYKWVDKNLTFEFGPFIEPETAVMVFLSYVKRNKINVKKLARFG